MSEAKIKVSKLPPAPEPTKAKKVNTSREQNLWFLRMTNSRAARVLTSESKTKKNRGDDPGNALETH